MIDQQQLALAAKAAGKRRNEWDYDWLRDCGHELARDMLWDPRRDSGQALELAAQLRLGTEFSEHCIYVFAHRGLERLSSAHVGEDIAAAMRLAIFRAAVVIGAAML